ncbi:MAG: hypothetical protein JSW07_08020 [bacterium]|nr:MAG: hypothetical protein JSW07_08020 [bacterium]
MKRIYSHFIICILIFSLNSSIAYAQLSKYLTIDPENASFVYEDIYHFVRAHALLTPESDSVAILQKEYLDRGTPGLKMFIEKYELTAESLVKAIRKHPEKYASLGEMPELLYAQEPSFRKAYAKLKDFIPNAVFLPTYFLIGDFRGIGSGSTEGTLISVEKWIKPIDHKKTTLVHELVHIQQVLAVGYDKYKALFGPEKSLLGLCIREGTAEFFADLVTGKIGQDEALEYTRRNEKRLWKWFKKEMYGQETGDWMWTKPTDPEQQQHVGYAMGYLIVKAYYDNAKDKAKAAREIIAVTNYSDFLEKSGYEKQ